MTTQDPPPNGIDISRPNVARIYDYLLGGKDNFTVDREAAKQLLAVTPDIAGIVRDNRSFIGRVVHHVATEGGIRQFLDLGGGLPTQTNVHEMAQQVVPDARVVYVDIDPVVWSHGQALLAHGDQVAMVRADLREPAEVMRHPDVLRLLDLTEPVAVVCASVLHFVSDEDDPYRIVAEYRDRLARGSYLAISHGAAAHGRRGPRRRRRRRDQRVPPGFGAAARPVPGRDRGFLRRLRPDRTRCGLDQRVAAGPGFPVRGTATVTARRCRPQALTNELVVDPAFGGGQRVTGAAPAELDQLGGD